VSEIVNLNHARKARARAEEKALAAENRAKFGRSKAEKDRARAETLKAERALDQARREP
jgi:hypothetical protein